MKIEILKKCKHPNGIKDLQKGDVFEVHNDLGRKFVKAGLAQIIPRVSEDWEVIEELGKQVRKQRKKSEKEKEESPE